MESKEGTIEFVITHEHADWRTNDKPYKFGPFDAGPYELNATKESDGNMKLVIEHGDTFHAFKGPVPTAPNKKNGVYIAVTWNTSTISLYVDGEKVLEKPLPTVP